MPKPSLVSSPINLKTTRGTSIFWLEASDVAAADTVKIVKTNHSAGFWEGTIDSAHGNKKGWKVKVTYNSGNPLLPPGKRRSKKVYAAGDVFEVNITVTNATGESDPLTETVIID